MQRPPDPRSDARERALYLLYEAHTKGISPEDALALQLIEPDELTVALVNGVLAALARELRPETTG